MPLPARIVLLTGASDPAAQTIAEVLMGEGADVVTWADELFDEQRIDAAAAALARGRPRLDALINLTPVASRTRFVETSAPELRRMVYGNYQGPMLATNAVLPLLRASTDARVVNVTSLDARGAWPGGVAYGATCAAFAGYTESLRKDIGQAGIRVTLVLAAAGVEPANLSALIAQLLTQPRHLAPDELILRRPGELVP